MENGSRKPRKSEDANKRANRLLDAQQQRLDDDAANDERIDEMVRRNIKQRGA